MYVSIYGWGILVDPLAITRIILIRDVDPDPQSFESKDPDPGV